MSGTGKPPTAGNRLATVAKWAAAFAALGVAAWASWPWLHSVVTEYDRRAALTSSDGTAPAHVPGQEESGPEASFFEDRAAGDSIKRMHGAMLEAEAGRHDQAQQLFRETLALVERNQGAASPMAALVHFQVSLMHQRRRDLAEEERALRRALAIMEQYSDAELKRASWWGEDGVDVAMVAASLGYIYWEWRRPEEAYAWYERAHQVAPRLSTTERNRNRRLAVSAAGLMVSACTLGRWEIADQAMAELKERAPGVEPELRKWLDYWVRTGEPRLKSRKC